MTIPFSCTKQHTRDVCAGAVARNRTEQSGELTPFTSRCLPGVARAGSHRPCPYRAPEDRHRAGVGLRVVRAFQLHRVPSTPNSRQLSLSASGRSVAEQILHWQPKFAASETMPFRVGGLPSSRPQAKPPRKCAAGHTFRSHSHRPPRTGAAHASWPNEGEYIGWLHFQTIWNDLVRSEPDMFD